MALARGEVGGVLLAVVVLQVGALVTPGFGQLGVVAVEEEIAWTAAQAIAAVLDLEADPVGFQQLAAEFVIVGQFAHQPLVGLDRAQQMQAAGPLGIDQAGVEGQQR